MAFVLDCSVTMAWVFADEATVATDRLRDALLETRAFVPALWPIETANVLLVATRRGRIAQDEWPGILAHLDALPIDIDPISTSRTWGKTLDLATAHGISAYDAMYLDHADAMPLATLDRALMRSADRRSPRWTGLSAPPGSRQAPISWKSTKPDRSSASQQLTSTSPRYRRSPRGARGGAA